MSVSDPGPAPHQERACDGTLFVRRPRVVQSVNSASVAPVHVRDHSRRSRFTFARPVGHPGHPVVTDGHPQRDEPVLVEVLELHHAVGLRERHVPDALSGTPSPSGEARHPSGSVGRYGTISSPPSSEIRPSACRSRRAIATPHAPLFRLVATPPTVSVRAWVAYRVVQFISASRPPLVVGPKKFWLISTAEPVAAAGAAAAGTR